MQEVRAGHCGEERGSSSRHRHGDHPFHVEVWGQEGVSSWAGQACVHRYPRPHGESKAAEKPRGCFPGRFSKTHRGQGPVWQQIQATGTTGRHQATEPPWPEGPWTLHMPRRAESPASGRWAPSPRSRPVSPPPGSPCPFPGSVPPVRGLIPLC